MSLLDALVVLQAVLAVLPAVCCLDIAVPVGQKGLGQKTCTMEEQEKMQVEGLVAVVFAVRSFDNTLALPCLVVEILLDSGVGGAFARK